MSERPPPDPAAFFREMLGQWESVANAFGGELMRSGEFARTMQGATSAGVRAQQAAHEVMSRALAAANMPSRAEVVDLAERMASIDARLARIEAALFRLGAAEPPPARPKPKRTRRPPEKPAK